MEAFNKRIQLAGSMANIRHVDPNLPPVTKAIPQRQVNSVGLTINLYRLKAIRVLCEIVGDVRLNLPYQSLIRHQFCWTRAGQAM